MNKQLNRTLVTLVGLGVTAGILVLAGIRLITSAESFNFFLVLGLCCLAGSLMMLAFCYRLFAKIRLQMSKAEEEKLGRVLKQTTQMLNATKRMKNDQQGLIKLLNSLDEAAWMKDSNNQFIFANQKLGQLLNVDPSVLVNDRESVAESEFLKHLDDIDQETLNSGHSGNVELATGNEYYFNVKAYPIQNTEQKIVGTASTAHDISAAHQLRTLEEKWHYMDPLTNLGNRKLAQRWLNEAIQNSQKNHRGVAVLYVDIDDFTLLNHNLGPEKADQCLIEVAQRLATMVRENCMAVRLSADQFALLYSQIDNPQAILELAAQIQQSLSQPLFIEDQNLNLNISLGMARYPEHGDQPWTLIQQAEKDMRTMRQQQKAN